MIMFQSTHPHGVRLPIAAIEVFELCFNPRTRTGCDFAFAATISAVSVSIHAPARGATDSFLKLFDADHVSIHAPARGATAGAGKTFTLLIVSIHAPARGATTAATERDNTRNVSIHAPARGATKKAWQMWKEYLFQSTHPHGVRPHRGP